MTEDQIAELLKLLELGRSPDRQQSPERIFLRGWNAGLDFALEQIAKVRGLPTHQRGEDAA